MKTEFLPVIPVLPSATILRGIISWHAEKRGFIKSFSNEMYASLVRENLCIHLQWHADTNDDPLLGGSVIRIG